MTAYSTKPFTVTFPSSQIVDATSFASQIDFIAGVNANSVVISDVDGDGKPDLVAFELEAIVLFQFLETQALPELSRQLLCPRSQFYYGK